MGMKAGPGGTSVESQAFRVSICRTMGCGSYFGILSLQILNKILFRVVGGGGKFKGGGPPVLLGKKYYGAARLVLSFKNHIRRRGRTVARTARDLRLPQVPEAPVNTHRPREATAVGPAETIAPACQNFTTGAHAIRPTRVPGAGALVEVNFEDEQGRAPD